MRYERDTAARVVIATVVALLSANAEAPAKTRDLNITLRFSPQENTSADVPAIASGFLSRTVAISPIKDGRLVSDKRQVGENTEEDTPVRILTSDDVAAYVTDVFSKCVGEWGVKLDQKSDLILSGELIRFFVAEDALYFAEVRLTFRLENHEGKILWEGTSEGDARRFGRSLKEENYNEALSDAMKEAYAKLLSIHALQEAWAGKRPDPSNVVIGTSPDVLLAELIELKNQGLSTDLMVAYVKQKILSVPFTAQDLVKWKQAGMPEAVIQAALERSPGGSGI